jgi:hypothetical protein
MIRRTTNVVDIEVDHTTAVKGARARAVWTNVMPTSK